VAGGSIKEEEEGIFEGVKTGTVWSIGHHSIQVGRAADPDPGSGIQSFF
jgi:hypothetical protein